MEDDAIQEVKHQCALALDRLKREVFTPEVYLTLVMRHPTDEGCFMVVTADPSIPAVCAALMNAEEPSVLDPGLEERE